MYWKDVGSPHTMEISCLNKDFKYQVNVVNSVAYLLAFPASYWTDNGAKWKNRFKILLIWIEKKQEPNKHIDRMLEMTSDAPTNAVKDVTSSIA